MANQVQSKCLCCGDNFTVDVRNRGRQKDCAKRACRAAGKAARQRRWLDKTENRDYFRGPVYVERVRAWRAGHPGYWRTHRRDPGVALQEPLCLKSLNLRAKSKIRACFRYKTRSAPKAPY